MIPIKDLRLSMLKYEQFLSTLHRILNILLYCGTLSNPLRLLSGNRDLHKVIIERAA